MTEGNFADNGTCSTKMGDGIVEINDMIFVVETRDEGFHSWMTMGFIMADMGSCGEELFNCYVAWLYGVLKVAFWTIADHEPGRHSIEDILA